jgi:hypothetical protein
MKDPRTRHLKIKVKHLAAEAQLIRQEARKTKGKEKAELNTHRTQVLRPIARLNLLAYALIRGVPYHRAEAHTDRLPNFSRIETIAQHFGASPQQTHQWTTEAIHYIRYTTEHKHHQQPSTPNTDSPEYPTTHEGTPPTRNKTQPPPRTQPHAMT